MTNTKKPPRHRCPECRRLFVLVCSFCGKRQDHVTKLVAGHDAYICDECLALCLEVMLEEKVWNVETIIRTYPREKEEKPTS